ncbi:MAG: ATP-binding cassette domain-containing protein [Candidatus Marinimicrobia bacterium]|nr:ATP-binding cassette domain-containing protein [Candidatus Neomarinimicrobiota bacterium]
MLKTKNLCKKYDEDPIIHDLNMHLKRGEKVCLFAPSGTGKTTLIKIINGLITNYQGKVEVSSKNISTIFQSPDLFWYKTVKENILFPLQLKNIKFDSKIDKIYQAWIKTTELHNKEHLYPHELSGGMKQKVALARGFIFNPDFILLDEPFNSIDIRAKEKIINFILEHYPQKSFLFVTHNLEEIPKLADKIFLFKKDMLSGFKEIIIEESEDSSTIIKNIFEELY